MGLTASVFGEGNREFSESELKLTQKDDESLLTGQVGLSDSKFLISLKGLEKYKVPGGALDQKPSGKVSIAEQAALLVQKPSDRVLEKHHELLNSLQSEVRGLKSKEVDVAQQDLTRKLQGLCFLFDAILRSEAREANRLKARDKKAAPKPKGKELPPIAQVGLRFGIETLLCLVSRVGESNAMIYRDVIRIATGVLSQLPPMSLQVEDSSLAQCIDSVSSFFEHILNGEVPVLNEQDQMSVLSPLLGLALAKGNMSAALSVATKFLSLAHPQNFEVTAQLMQETLSSLATMEGKVGTRMAFNWNPAKLGPQIALSEENRTVTRTTSDAWGCQLSEQGITTGVHYVEFFIKTNSSTCLLLGLANRSFSDFGSKSSGSNCWTLQSDGDTYMNGSGSGNLFRYNQGDRVGLLIDMNERKLTYFFNGTKQSRDAFGGLPDEVFLLSCFGGSNQFVEITADPALPAEVQGLVGAGKPRRADEEHKAPEAEEEAKEGEEVCLFPTASHAIIKSPKLQKLGSPEKLPASELGDVSPQTIAVYLLACLDKLNEGTMEGLGLNEEPTGLPVKGALQTQSGMSISVQGSVLSYFNSILHKCADVFQSQSWAQLDYQLAVWSSLTTLRLLRLHLFTVQSLQVPVAESGLTDELRMAMYQVLKQLLKVNVTHFGTEHSTKEDTDALEAIRHEVMLTLTHCFEIFCSSQTDKLDFLQSALQEDESSHPVEIKLQSQLLAKMSLAVNLSPVFDLSETSIPKIQDFTTLLLEKAQTACLKKLAGEEVQEDYLDLLTAVTNVLLSKLAKAEKTETTTSLYIDFLDKVMRTGEVVLQELKLNQAEGKARLKDSLLDRVCSTALLSVSLAKPDLKLTTRFITQLLRFQDCLSQIDADKAVLTQTVKQETEVYESEHPYPNSANLTHTVQIPGAKKYTLTFDAQCKTENNYDYLELWTDSTKTTRLHRWENTEFAGRTFEIDQPLLFFTFTSDGGTNFWGWKIIIETTVDATYMESSWLDKLRSSTTFVLVQLSRQLIQGEFAELAETSTLASFWANPLIKHGIKDRLPSMLGHQAQLDEGLLNLASSFQRAELPMLRKSKSAIDFMESKTSAQAVGRALNAYVLNFEGSSRKLANYSEVAVLEEFIAGSDRVTSAWKELKKKAGVSGPHFNIGGDELEAAERGVFAVYVAFFELSDFLQNYLNNPTDIGKTLRFMVKEANNIRKTAQLLRQQQIDSGKETNYTQVTAQLVEKCVVLLNSEYKQALNELGVNKVLANLLPGLNRAQSEQPVLKAGSKWTAVKKVVSSMSKLKLLLRLAGSSDKEEQGDEVKEFMRVARIVTDVLSSSIPSEDLAKTLNSRRNRALARSIGLCNIAQVFKSDETAQAQVSQAFSEAFVDKEDSVKRHYSRKLEGVDAGLFDAVQSSFFFLYQLLLNKFNTKRVEQTDCTSQENTQSFLTTYDALAFPFETVDSHVLLDLNLVNPLRFLLSWAQGQGITETLTTKFNKERLITEIIVSEERQFDQSQEGFSLALINRIAEGDFEDGLGEHPRLCMTLKRNTAALPIVDFVISAEVPEGFEDLGNVNEVGEELKLSVRRSAESHKYLVELKVVDYNPIKLAATYATADDLLVPDVSEKERESRAVRRSLLQKGAWDLYRLVFYSCAGNPENQSGAAEAKKSRLQEAFIETVFEYLQWKPSQATNIEHLSLGSISSGKFWQSDNKVIRRAEGSLIPNFISNLRKTVLAARSQYDAEMIDEFLSSIDRYFTMFDPSMKGVTKVDTLDIELVHEIGGELERLTNEDQEVDFFKYLGLALSSESDFHPLSSLLGTLPSSYKEAKAQRADDSIEALISRLATEINPSESSFLPYVALFQNASERPGVVPKSQLETEVPSTFLNSEGDLDLFAALHAIEANQAEFAGYWAEIKSIVTYKDLPLNALSLYSSSVKEQELQASLLWTLLQSSSSKSFLKVLARPVFLSQLTKHMLLNANLRVKPLAFKLVSLVLASQHSPQSFDPIWQGLEQAQPTLLHALLTNVGKTSFGLLDASASSRASYESGELLKALFSTDRWAAEVKALLDTSLAHYKESLAVGYDAAVSTIGAGALQFLASCSVKDDLSEPLEWTKISLRGAGIGSGVLLKVTGDNMKVFSPQDDSMHTELIKHYAGVIPERIVQVSSIFSEAELTQLFTTLRTISSHLRRLSTQQGGSSLTQSIAEKSVWRQQLQLSVRVSATLVNENLDSAEVDDLLNELFTGLNSTSKLDEAKQRYKAVTKLLTSRHSQAKETAAESVTVAKSLFRLKKTDDAEFHTLDASFTAAISQLDSGAIIVKDFLNQERKASLRKFNAADLRTFQSFIHEVTILASASLVAPCTEGVLGLLLGDVEIKIEVSEGTAVVKVGDTVLKTAPAENNYSFRIFAKWDGSVTVQDYNSDTTQTSLHSQSLYDGAKLGNIGVFLDKGLAASLRGLMVVEGHFVGQVNFVESVPSQEVPRADAHYITVDKSTLNLTEQRLGALGASPSAIAQALQCSEYEEALRTLLNSDTSSWPDVLSSEFNDPAEVVIVDCVDDLEANDQILPIFENGVQVGVSSDLIDRRVLALRKLVAVDSQATLSLTINEAEGHTELGELSLPFEGETDYSNKLYARRIALDKIGSRAPLNKAILVRCARIDQLTLPPGFELVSNDGKAVNISRKSESDFVFLAVSYANTLNGVPVNRLIAGTSVSAGTGLVDSLSENSSDKEKQEAALVEELKGYSQGSIVELHSAQREQDGVLLSAANKELLLRLLNTFPNKLNELSTTRHFTKLLSVLDNLDSLKQSVVSILKTESNMPAALLQETVLQLVLDATKVSSVKKILPVEVECAHPYSDNMDTNQEFSFPGAEGLVIEFDPLCNTESGCDILRFYTQSGHANQVFQNSGTSGWNKTEVEGNVLHVYFHSDGSRTEWGYKFTITPIFKKTASKADPLRDRANLNAALWILEEVVLGHSELPSSLVRFTRKELLNPLLTLMLTNAAEQTRVLSIIKHLLIKAEVTPYTQQVVDFLASEAARLNTDQGAKTSIVQQLSSLLVEIKDKFGINIKAKWFQDLSDAFDLMRGLVHRDHHIQPVLFEQFKAANKISSETTRMSAHPYSLKPSTKELFIEGADSLEIEFDEQSKMQDGDTVVFSSDPEARQLLIKAGASVSDARWGNNPRGPDIAFSNSNMTVTRTNSSGWGCAVWDRQYTSGRTKITMRIDNTGGSDYLYIGVWKVSPSYPLSDVISSGCSCPSWTWKVVGELHQPGSNSTVSNMRYTTGDNISFLIDMNARTMTCTKGTTTHVFTGLAEAVIPVICFGGSNQVVSIVSVEDESAVSEKLSKKTLTIEGDRFFYHYPANIGYLFTNAHSWKTKDEQTYISTDKLIARRTEGDHRSTINSSLVLTNARYFVEVLIKKGAENSAIQVGFVPSDFAENQSLINYTTAAYQQDGSAGFQETQLVAEAYGVGDRIGAYLDMKGQQVAFYKNGVEVVRNAVNFSASKYTFMVSFNAKGQEVVLTQGEIPQGLDLVGLNTAVDEEAKSAEWGFKFKVTPKFYGSNKMMVLRTLTDKQQELWEQYVAEQTKSLSRIVLEQVVAYIDEMCANQSKDPLQIQPEDLNPKPEELMHYTALEKLTVKEIQESFRLIKYFNKQVNLILPLISLDFSRPDSLQRLFLAVRGIIFAQMKNTSFNEIIGKTNSDARPEITIDRTKAMRAMDAGRVDNEGLFSIFGQIYRIMNPQPLTSLRNSERAFRVTFRGEGSIDAGGPYNEVISNMADELQSKMLPLFVPVQNQVHAIGENRDSWIVNPSATTESQMSMYLFLGKMMGVSIRTKNNLNFRFPQLFWKRLVMEDVTLQDLKSTDECCFQMLEILRNLSANGITADNFLDTFEGETMTTKDSSGNSVPVIEGGESQPLTYDRAVEYADLVERLRLNENEGAYRQIRRGMSTVVPLSLLNLFSWKQVETMVCGAPDVNVELLKNNTEYSGVDVNAPHVKFFWEVLAEFTPKERSLFLRFVWGRSRLPAGSDFRKFKMAAMNPGGNVDNYLPLSHTCFFTLDLPAYTSKQIMHDKLLYAITHCQAIDLDRMAEGGWEED
jgi:hypothetical protein